MYPQCNLGTNRPYREIMEGFRPGLKEYYRAPADFRVEPFRIFGNLYYVGDQKVCIHLIDTGEGLILLDSGYRHAIHILLDSIARLGYSPQDIRYIIHSHGHFDHFGGGNELRALYGAKVCMSRVDTQLLRQREDRALIHLGPNPDEPVCWPDLELKDGDHITLGNTDIRFVLSPGHTLGTLSLFFKVRDGGQVRQAGYLGGVGNISMYRQFCREYGLPENKSHLLGQTIQKLREESVDIVLGNHPSQNCTLEKREWMLSHPGENPFVDQSTWPIFLAALDTRRKSFLELGY